LRGATEVVFNKKDRRVAIIFVAFYMRRSLEWPPSAGMRVLHHSVSVFVRVKVQAHITRGNGYEVIRKQHARACDLFDRPHVGHFFALQPGVSKRVLVASVWSVQDAIALWRTSRTTDY
jgi:hypothetical protein